MSELKNRKHEAFVLAWAGQANFCGTDAIYAAGYKVTSRSSASCQAAKILARPEVQERVREVLTERREAERDEASRVLADLRAIVDRCMQAEPVLDRKGEHTGEWRFNASGATKALELLGRHLGLWNDKLSLQVSERKARDLLESAAVIIVKHVKDPTVLAALRAEFADLMGGGDA